MSLHVWTLLLGSLEASLAAVTLALLIRAKAVKQYWPLIPPVLSGVVPYFLLLWLRSYRKLTPLAAYNLYFIAFWGLASASVVCSGIVTYTIFHEALRPLKGLQALGTIMYRWAASISLAVALGAAILPSSNLSQGTVIAISQLQRASGIIIVSLILFVGFSIRSLGLSVRSRVFGVGVGIGLIAFANIVEAGYLYNVKSMYNSLGVTESLFECTAELIWIYYFLIPEPKRKFVLLPTTSPFHAWNQISEMLGHDPGYVAIGGVPPEAFAPAELNIFGRASANMAAADDAITRIRTIAPMKKVGAMSTPEEAQQQRLTNAEGAERLMRAFQASE